MTVQNKIKRLEELGRIPNEEDNLVNELVDEYFELVLNIEYPINYEEAKILIQLFPETEFYELESSLLHTFETIYKQIDETTYRDLINLCPSEYWRTELITRLENGIKRDNKLKELSLTAIPKLKELGQITDNSNTIENYADLLDSIKRPISLEDAKVLIQLFPHGFDGDNTFGIAWKLLQIIESVYKQVDKSTYKSLIDQCPCKKWNELMNNRIKKDLVGQ